jgi:16S rRNA (uracil1498-N3)-methyltransferase
MPIDRFYSKESFVQEEHLFIEGVELHHMAHVMRVKENEIVEFVNGRGELAKGRVISIQKSKAEVHLEEVQSHPLPKKKLILAQAAVRFSKLKLIVEKGTELGATGFFFYQGDKSEKGKVDLEKLQLVSIGAMKQCGRLYLPDFKEFTSLEDCVKSQKESCYFLDPHCSKVGVPKEGVFIIGPEKGFSPKELDVFNNYGIEGLLLNSNVLRTETAGIAILSVASYGLL